LKGHGFNRAGSGFTRFGALAPAEGTEAFMFNGTMIDELLQIVERAEEHAQTIELKTESNVQVMYPGFLAEVANTNQVWLGVA
jgi:hypothetical protein